MSFKKKLSHILTTLFFLVVIIAGVFWISAYEVKGAPSPAPSGSVIVSGYAWSENIGWIEFDPSFGGVFYDLATKKLSGYAWSENIGWIKFDGLSSYPDSLRGSVATVDAGGFLFGWIRACAGTATGDCSTMTSRADGWDGWISLSRKPSGTGFDYGVKIDLVPASQTYGDFSGYAWGSDLVGWIKFNCQDTPGECAQSDYKVKAVLPGVPLDVSCFAEPDNAYLNESVVFTAKPAGGVAPYSYKWTGDWMGGVLGTNVSNTTSFSTEGIKTATIEATDSLGKTALSNCSATIKKSLIAPTYRLEPISSRRDVGDNIQFNGFYDSDGVGSNQEVKINNTDAMWSETDNRDDVDVASINVAGLATCKAEDSDGANISSVYHGIEAGASLYCTDGIYGKCGVEGNNSCENGNLIDTTDSSSQYLWKCQGSKSTAYCSVDKLTPTVDISADKAFASIGDTATIEWKSTNAISCVPKLGDGGWKDATRKNYKATGYPEPETYETDKFAELPITFEITCASIDGKFATDSVTIVEKILPSDPSYNISPDYKNLKVDATWQFSGWFDSGKYGENKKNVTELASWTSLTPGIATIIEKGVNGGLATCKIDGVATITSTYKYANIDYTDTATLNCEDVSQPKKNLTVKKTGKGIVSGAVDCGLLCAGSTIEFNYGDKTWLTAEPGAGHVFNSYSVVNIDDTGKRSPGVCDKLYDDDNGDPSCGFTMTSSKEVTVVFESDAVSVWITADPIAVDKGETSTISWSSENATSCKPLGGDDDVNWEKATIDISGTFTTKAFGASGRAYEIECKNDLTSATDSVEISIKEPKKLTVTIVGNGMPTTGVVTSDDGNGIKCENDCEESYSLNSEVGLTANTKANYIFKGWSGDCVGIDETCELTMDEDKNVTATFIKEGDINITISNIAATIVNGLPANSNYDKRNGTPNLYINSSNCKDSKFDLIAFYDGKGGVVVIDSLGTHELETKQSFSLPYAGNLVVKNIPGDTEEEKYPITLIASCIDSATKQQINNSVEVDIEAGKNANTDLIIKRIDSGWQESQ